jgi:site-specific recombinase XerD
VIDEYLAFVAARTRPNTLLAIGYDLKVFFALTRKDPADVTTADVLDFIRIQLDPPTSESTGVVPNENATARALSPRTVKRRLASLSGLFAYLVARGDAGVTSNPVPSGLATRSPDHRRRSMPLVRAPSTLPRILEPAAVNSLIGALRKHRDRAMIEAMLLGGLRRSEVLDLRLQDLKIGEKRVFVREGKGGHQRIVPISPRFFTTVAAYLDCERPRTSVTDRLFVVLKGKNRGLPLSAAGLDEILAGARNRAGLERVTCHELRHTCFTRLREAGMALEAVQAQAGHKSIETTRIYLHLSNSWLANEYHKAISKLDPQPGA